MSFARNKLYIGTNFKMYKNITETEQYLQALAIKTTDLAREEVCVFAIPSYTALHAASLVVDPEQILLGAQNVFWEDAGPFTGEVSPLMLKEIGVKIVELGHSERRQYFGENDFRINKKVLSCLAHGFIVLLCVGETEEDKQLKITAERLGLQLKIALNGVQDKRLSQLWIAYEPVWAIGEQGTPASPEYANTIHKILRNTLVTMFPERGAGIPILYGGSVNKENAVELIKQPEIDGLFIGRAAWDASRFNEIIRAVLPIWRSKTSKLLSV